MYKQYRGLSVSNSSKSQAHLKLDGESLSSYGAKQTVNGLPKLKGIPIKFQSNFSF